MNNNSNPLQISFNNAEITCYNCKRVPNKAEASRKIQTF